MQNRRFVATNIDLDKVAQISGQLKALAKEMNHIFPEREDLIQQMIYALLTQEHVLIYGTFGTGKTDLLNTLFGQIKGSCKFSLDLTRFMTEANVIGLPDPKKMREEGKIVYQVDGGILACDFAELDEMLDSNPMLLRTMLGILHERMFKRGRQVEGAKLRTAVGCTNADPDEAIKHDQSLGAVIDRFLFHCKVDYLAKTESKIRMLEKHLRGEKPTVEIEFEDLVYISDIVSGADQITDPFIIETYVNVMEAYTDAAAKKKIPIILSDRRLAKLAHLIEASAILDGRYEVNLDDIAAVKWALCLGNCPEQHELFDATVLPIIETAKESRQPDVEQVTIELLEQLSAKIPAVPTTGYTSDDLVNLTRELLTLREKVEEIKPTLAKTKADQATVLTEIDTRHQKVRELIEKG